jgi:hypothetical protein
MIVVVEGYARLVGERQVLHPLPREALGPARTGALR